nr:hypothetical protein [Streptomyces sp. ISL-44]
MEAQDLTPGSTLLTDRGKAVIVTANKPHTQHARTYNLTSTTSTRTLCWRGRLRFLFTIPTAR